MKGANRQRVEIITDLYRVFGPYRVGKDFHGCEHCIAPHEITELSTKLLKQLTHQDVNRYAVKAMTTWGEVEHFKHFLPRLLELALEDCEKFDLPEVLFGKLEIANWSNWPRAERDAVEQYLFLFWRSELARSCRFPDSSKIETILGCLASACESLKPFLDIWLQIDDVIAAFHLCHLLSNCENDILVNGTVRCLWGNPAGPSKELTNWLGSDAVRHYLERFKQEIEAMFPFVLSQWEGIHAATR